MKLMHKRYEINSVKLNGCIYSSAEICDYSEKELKKSGLGKLQVELYRFYLDWFSPGNSIVVNSSGSTGKPKELFFDKDQLIGSAMQTGKYFDLDNRDNCLLCLPVQYIAGKMMVVRAMLSALDLITVKPASNPLENIHKNIDFAAMTPQQVFTSLSAGKNLNLLKTLIIGGGQVSPELYEKLQHIDTECYATYGLTETLTHIALRKLNGSGSQDFFECLPGVDIHIDHRMCLVIKATYLSGEIITNDIVEIIGKNSFRWMGRFDNVINSGGIKIYPEKVEQQIEGFIRNKFFIASRPDDSLGEKLLLIFEGPELTEKGETMLFDKMKTHLPPYHCPKEVIYLPQFVYTDTGKINRIKTIGLAFNPIKS